MLLDSDQLSPLFDWCRCQLERNTSSSSRAQKIIDLIFMGHRFPKARVLPFVIFSTSSAVCAKLVERESIITLGFGLSLQVPNLLVLRAFK